MAFAVLLAQKLGIDCIAYDPAYTETDRRCISQLDKTSLQADNNSCAIELAETSLVVGVHLFKELYQNVIMTNRTKLCDLVLIGNSISKMVEHHSLDFSIDGLKSVVNEANEVFDVGRFWAD